MKNALLMFVKYPEPGKVKTRLAKSVGHEKAAAMYKELVEKNSAVIRPLHGTTCDCWIAFDPPQQETQMRAWLTDLPCYIAQQGEGLGERLTHAFREMFQRGYTRVAALGSDTLNLKAELIQNAFNNLSDHDVVLGPARDGGYYLIALNRLYPELFQGINWSTAGVLPQTHSVIRRLKLKVHELSPLDDLDKLHKKK